MTDRLPPVPEDSRGRAAATDADAEASRASGETSLRRALMAAGIGVCRTDLDGTILDVDRASLAIVDLDDLFPDPRQLVGRRMADVESPYLAHWQQAVDRVHGDAGGANEPWLYHEVRIRTVKGVDKWVGLDSFVVPGSEGEQPSVQFVVRDVTAHKRAEAALAEHRALLDTMLENLPFDLFVLDRDGRYVLQNACCREHWGDVVGKRPEEVGTDAQAIALWIDNNRRAFAGELVREEQEFEYEGERRTVFNVLAPIRHRGEITGALGINVDVTEQRCVERRFRELHDNVPVGVFRVSGEGRWMSANPAALRILGHDSLDELRGVRPEAFFVDEERRRTLAALVEAEGVVEDFEARIWRQDGAERWVSLGVTAVRGPSGEVGHFDGNFQDVTASRQLEEQLHHAAKMEAVGRLAGGIAHDFNNLLTGILGHASMLTRRGTESEAVARSARAIEQAAERAHELTEQLLGFARKGKYRRESVTLHESIREVAELVTHTLGSGVRVELALRADRSTVVGDPGQLHQVLLNLLLNAGEAMPAGGTVTVRTRVVEDARRPPTAVAVEGGGASLPPPGTAAIEVAVEDTGSGIQPAIIPRIFDPFFSTKDGQGGAGMGLAMVYGIVQRHHGTITAKNRTGKGAVFCVRLPLWEGGVDARGEQDSGGADTPDTVLVVDDDPLVRRTATLLLESLGHTVLGAEGGREAVEIYREQGHRIGLVLLDLVMPEMDGRACAQALRELDAGVCILLTTGHQVEQSARETLAAGAAGFIAKPYSLDSLGAAVRKALASAAGRQAR